MEPVRSGSYYEAYGFWKDQSSLQQYEFVHDEKIDELLGRINKDKLPDGNLIIEIADKEKNSKFMLQLSRKQGEVLLKSL